VVAVKAQSVETLHSLEQIMVHRVQVVQVLLHL
jgi:hypothetical protein